MNLNIIIMKHVGVRCDSGSLVMVQNDAACLRDSHASPKCLGVEHVRGVAQQAPGVLVAGASEQHRQLQVDSLTAATT